MGADERTVRDMHAAWIEAVNAGDLARLLDLMTDEALFLNPGRPPTGRNDFSAGFSQAHRNNQIRCVSALEEVVVAGNVAYTMCKDSLEVAPRAGGDAMRLAGERITVYRKQADGRWLVSRDIHTLSPV